MTTTGTRGSDPLAPVRDALVARARDDAQAQVRAAQEEAGAAVRAAQQEADAVRAEARAQGEADAEAVLVRARTAARRQAREVVLRAQREVYDDLHQRVRHAVTTLREDPRYPLLLALLEVRARKALGPDAQVREAPEGGVTAESSGRRYVCTLPDLAEAALAAVEPDLEKLWSR